MKQQQINKPALQVRWFRICGGNIVEYESRRGEMGDHEEGAKERARELDLTDGEYVLTFFPPHQADLRGSCLVWNADLLDRISGLRGS